MAELTIVTADDAYGRMKSGKALLVCAYEDEERFRRFHLEGAIPFANLESMRPVLSADREIIFYCA